MSISTLHGGEEKYCFKSCIGCGAYGQVYEAKNTVNNTVVAIKVMAADEGEGLSSNVLREISLLKHMNHTNIIKF